MFLHPPIVNEYVQADEEGLEIHALLPLIRKRNFPTAVAIDERAK
jgi:hypothetical protein